MIKYNPLLLFFILTILITPGQMALAEDMMQNNTQMREHQPDADQVIFDALIYRPLSVLDMFAGIGVFIATLPLTLPTGKVEKAGDAFVTNPMETTLKNCIGCLPGHPQNRK